MQPEPQEISLLRLFSRHWKLSIFVVAACTAIAGLLTAVMPRRYEASMKFLVNNERADLVITPEKTSPASAPNEVSEAEVNSEIELLRSHDILAAIVEDSKLNRSYLTKKNISSIRFAKEKAIARLSKDLNVTAIHKTNIIAVKYRTIDPDLAAFVLNDLSQRYLNEHLAVHSAPGTYQFFTDEVEKHRKAWTEAQWALNTFHRQKQLFALSQQQSALVNRLATVETQIKDLDTQIAEEQTRLNANRERLEMTPERVITQVKQVPDQMATGPLETMLVQLRNRRAELTMKFKPGDRLISEVDQEIANTESSLAAVKASPAAERTTDVDPLHQSLNTDVVRGNVFVKALQTRHIRLAAMRDVYLQQLDEMDNNAVSLSNLEQNERDAQENYQLYSRRLEEAKLANSLDREKFANVAMVEKPVASPIPVSPNMPLNLLVGAIIGAILGLGLAFLVDRRGSHTSESERKASSNLYPDHGLHATASGD